MSKNPLLLGWLMDTKDDCFPYYLSKLEFLQMYGKQCSSNINDCKNTTTKEYGIKHIFKYTYTYSDCKVVIDRICSYYNKDGSIREDEWGEEQVSYINDLYKVAVSTKFGEFMLGKDYDQTIKTTAFQLISEKFNHLEYTSSEETKCTNYIKNVLIKNEKFMKELNKMREKAYNNIKEKHSEPFIFTNTIKNSELSLYVFELLKTKKCGNYKTIFTHNSKSDNEIFNILTKPGGLCFKEEHENNKSSAFFKLSNFDKEDFEYKAQVSTTSFIWNLHKTIFDIVKNSIMGVGNVIIYIGKSLLALISKKGIVDACMICVLILSCILMLLMGIVQLGPGTTGVMKNVKDFLFKDIDISIFVPYINAIIYPIKALICLLLPFIQITAARLYIKKLISPDETKKDDRIPELLKHYVEIGLFANIGLTTTKALFSGKFNINRFTTGIMNTLIFPFDGLCSNKTQYGGGISYFGNGFLIDPPVPRPPEVVTNLVTQTLNSAYRYLYPPVKPMSDLDILYANIYSLYQNIGKILGEGTKIINDTEVTPENVKNQLEGLGIIYKNIGNTIEEGAILADSHGMNYENVEKLLEAGKELATNSGITYKNIGKVLEAGKELGNSTGTAVSRISGINIMENVNSIKFIFTNYTDIVHLKPFISAYINMKNITSSAISNIFKVITSTIGYIVNLILNIQSTSYSLFDKIASDIYKLFVVFINYDPMDYAKNAKGFDEIVKYGINPSYVILKVILLGVAIIGVKSIYKSMTKSNKRTRGKPKENGNNDVESDDLGVKNIDYNESQSGGGINLPFKRLMSFSKNRRFKKINTKFTRFIKNNVHL